MLKLEDHRRFPRVDVHAPLRYQLRGKPDFSNVVANNISLGGLSFNNSGFIAPETVLTLQVNVLSRILNSVAKVAWTNSLPRSDRYQLGVEFMEMEPLEKKFLEDFISLKTA